MERQIGVSLPHFAARRYGYDSELPHQLSKHVPVAIAATFLCIAFQQITHAQTIPGSRNAMGRADAMAFCVGVSQQLERLRDLSRQPTPENSAQRIWLHQHILEEVTAGSLQVDATVAQIDYESSIVNALSSSLEDARDRTVNRLNLAGLIVGGSLGMVSSSLALSQKQAHNSTLAGISAGVLSSGLALAGLRAQKGRSKVLSSDSNMLADLFGREALPDSRYQQIVAAFLNQATHNTADTTTRKARLIAGWIAEHRIDSLVSDAGKARIDRVTSSPSAAIPQSIEDLENRASMLADLRATISLIKQDLATLLLSLPSAEAGAPDQNTGHL